MHALLLTNNFFAFGGSELSAAELAEELISRGWNVDIQATVIGLPLAYSALAKGIRVNTISDRPIDVAGYDLVWSQHGTLGNIEIDNFDRMKTRPLMVVAHLSPSTPLELPLHPLEERLADWIVANSEETRDSLRPYFPTTNIKIHHNPAPKAFFHNSLYGMSHPVLTKVLSVTNHLPGELYHVLLHMEKDLNIEVVKIGYGSDFRRVRAQDVFAADMVLGNGKTIQYAIVGNRPAFIYDHLGGDGWLTHQNFKESAYYNFSGRPNKRRRSPEILLKEILEGYASARLVASELHESQANVFSLGAFVDELLTHQLEHRYPWRLDESEIRICRITQNLVRLMQVHHVKNLGLMTSSAFEVPSLTAYFA